MFSFLSISRLAINVIYPIRAGHDAKSEDLHGDKTMYELRRQYHCAAYNMLTAVISCTQNKLQFYTGFLFKEEPSKVRIELGFMAQCLPFARHCSHQGQYLWENLVDLDREYHFAAELEVPIDRKSQMTAIRDEVHALSTRDSSPGAASPPCTCVCVHVCVYVCLLLYIWTLSVKRCLTH